MNLVLTQESALRILVGFIAGFIIGLERQKEIERSRSKQAGLRTFSLIGLTGTLAYLPGDMVLAATISMAFGLFVAVYAYYRLFGQVEVGVTTPVAMLATFVMGSLAGLGYITEALAGALVTTLVLTTKSELRSIAMRIEKHELISVIELATLITLVYPLVPNYTDPITGAVNLRVAYFIARLLMTISLANYVMLKLLGPKGVVTFGLLGGFVSSEATTYSVYSELGGGRIPMATALASIVALYLKILLIVGILEKDLISGLIKPSIVGILLSGTMAIAIAGRASVTIKRLPSPISYSSALKFTITFLTISFFVALVEKLASQYYILAVILSSLVSVTAVAFSVVAMYPYLGAAKAVYYLTVAMAVGTLNKIIYAFLGAKNKREIAKLGLMLSIIAAFVLLSNGILAPRTRRSFYPPL